MTFAKINDLKIYYSQLGKGQALILLHGMFLDSRIYKDFIQILSKHYCVYAIDLPGFGKSQTPKKYVSISDISAILKEFIDKLKIKMPILCSNSGSCLIAIDYASSHNLKGLILIDPAGIKYYDSWIVLLFRTLIMKTLSELFSDPVKAGVIIRVGLYNIFRNIVNINFWRLFRETYKQDYSEQMRKISCPTTLLWGKYDEVFPIRYSEHFKQSIRNSKLIEINGNHDWLILKPNEILKYIKDL